ncbi:MAG: COG4315 family predicted lipoprotein, partial [Chloroflexota bacterium]
SPASSAAPSSAAASAGGGAYAAPAGGSPAASANSAPSTAASSAPAAASVAASASAQASVAAAPVAMVTSIAVSTSGSLGKFLVDGRGHSLYTFAKDQKDVSNCNGGCAAAWPPAEAASVPALPAGTAGTLALMARAPGGQQLTYNGAPLYFFKADTAAGSTKGNGVGGVWHLATVAAS